MAEWLKNYPEMYNKGKKDYSDMDRKEAAWATKARVMGMEGEFQLPLYYYTLYFIACYYLPPRPGSWAWKVSFSYPYTIVPNTL